MGEPAASMRLFVFPILASLSLHRFLVFHSHRKYHSQGPRLSKSQPTMLQRRFRLQDRLRAAKRLPRVSTTILPLHSMRFWISLVQYASMGAPLPPHLRAEATQVSLAI